MRPQANEAATVLDQPDLKPIFALQAAEGALVASGVRRALEPGRADTLAARVRRFFAEADDGPRLLVGALPFEREQADRLFQPQATTRAARAFAAAAPAAAPRWTVQAEPTAVEYAAAVSRALRLMQSDGDPLAKVVLSRSLLLTADRAIDPMRLAASLADDPSVTCFMAHLGAAASGQARTLVGATPELLVSKDGRAIASHPLAGSSPRYADAAQDRASAAGLERSDKDRREHATVVEAILDTLAPYCSQLDAPQDMVLRPTATMWHLGTRIEGQLKDADVSSAELAAALHPTPAVGGFPRARAQAVIRDLESYDRGFYAGAVGWTDAAGDGVWHVSLRCAEVAGPQVRIYAGAGIVPGSSPEGEVEETSAKFQTMLRALGVDEGGNLLEAGGR
jgi:isochorismate synthase